jgi:hypothetical protein
MNAIDGKTIFEILLMCVMVASVACEPASKAPPVIIVHPRNQTVTGSQSIYLECRVDGHPKPVVTWYKDDMELVANATESDSATGENHILLFGMDLLIVSASASDAGTYWCRATNGREEATSRKASVSVDRRKRFARLNGNTCSFKTKGSFSIFKFFIFLKRKTNARTGTGRC